MPRFAALVWVACGAIPSLFAGDFARFRTQEVAKDLTIGYAVAIADLNQDGKPDIIVVDKHRVIWYENPSWKMRTILQGKTRPDNVCLAVADLNGDGKLDIVLGADWAAPFNTKSGGTLQWLKRGPSLDDEWTLIPIGEEPTVHRVRMMYPDGPDRAPWIVLGPLMGQDSTAKANWMDGRPVRVIAYPIPADPVKGPWKREVLNESLHVMHNFWPLPLREKESRAQILTASYEGVHLLERSSSGPWKATRIGEGNQANLKGNRGASEIKQGHFADHSPYIATIEPWHGNQVVVYTPAPGQPLWTRKVIDEELRWGHAVWCANLDADADEELIIGVRDNPNPKAGDKHTLKSGVRVYKRVEGEWQRQIVDDGGVAVEDLAAADLNGDGRIDLVAVGRATKNVRIYWNEGR